MDVGCKLKIPNKIQKISSLSSYLTSSLLSSCSMANQMSAITARDGSIGHDIETNGSRHHVVQIEMTTMEPAAAEGGREATAPEDDPPIRAMPEENVVGRERGSGTFISICAVILSFVAAAISRPTPKGLYSEDLLIVVYTLNLIMLLVLGFLLLGLSLALALIPDNWVPAVRAAAKTVTVALLVLLLFLVAFVTYGLVRQDLP